MDKRTKQEQFYVTTIPEPATIRALGVARQPMQPKLHTISLAGEFDAVVSVSLAEAGDLSALNDRVAASPFIAVQRAKSSYADMDAIIIARLRQSVQKRWWLVLLDVLGRTVGILRQWRRPS